MRNSISARSKTKRQLAGISALSLFLLVGFASLAGAQAVPPGSKPNASSQSKPAAHRKPVHSHKKAAAPAPEAAVAAPPPPPPMPKWPVNESPTQPKVQWDSKGLSIDAQNSSLRQILNEVTTLTGAKVEGFGNDERVFGDYGPGQAREVIAQLLHGTGYNVLIFGDQGQGTPREIVLSPRRDTGNQAPAANNPPGAYRPPPDNPDDDEPQQPVIDEQQPSPPMLSPPSPPRTPQQIMMEMQQRQQEMQRQQQLQNNPPPQ